MEGIPNKLKPEIKEETEEEKIDIENCGGHIVILVYSSYVCNAPVDVEKILQLYMIPV